MTIWDEHSFDSNYVCLKCKRTHQDVCDKQLHCAKQPCVECTLVRTCVGEPPRCEECIGNMQQQETLPSFGWEVEKTEAKEFDPKLLFQDWDGK